VRRLFACAGGLGEVLLHDLEPSLPRRYFSNVVDAVCTSVSAAVREVVSSPVVHFADRWFASAALIRGESYLTPQVSVMDQRIPLA
jgi:hypothetical protein